MLMAGKNAQTEGRISARPAAGAISGPAPIGLRPLGLDMARDGYLYVPPGYRSGYPAPLALLLHGADEDARDGLALLRGQADGAGLILLALGSQGPTWDLIVGRGRYGPDIAAIDRALEQTFSLCAVDPARVAVGGYSDGASYALSLGIANENLFTHVLAFSPGLSDAQPAGGLPAHLRLPRDARRLAPHRPLQPQDRPAAGARRLRGALPGVRGRPRGPARDRA